MEDKTEASALPLKGEKAGVESNDRAAYPGYPPQPQPGMPQPLGGSGYPPQPQPGMPQPPAPGGAAPPPGGAYPDPRAEMAAGLVSRMPQLAQNLPQTEVTWMPLPEGSAPPGCPPGLEYLTQIDQILVHQQIEIFELMTGFETENKYRVCNTLGQQVYFASETSSAFQQQCCHAYRQFSMAICDNSQKEVIHLERPLKCPMQYCCTGCCSPQTIEVQAPPGTVIGYVNQDPLGILHPWFSITNTEGETVLKIKGPFLGCSCYSDTHFEVLSADGVHSVGKITKQWSGLAKEMFTDADNFGISFPMDLDVKMKAVMLGACFLIDFMFFESAGGGGQNRGHHHHHHHY